LRNLRHFLLLLTLIICGTIFISDKLELIDLTGKVQEIEKTIGDKLKLKVVIDGGAVLKFLLTPHIEVIGFKIFDGNKLVFRSDKLLLKIPPTVLLGLSDLDNVNVEMNDASIEINDLKPFLEFTKDDFDITVRIDKVNVEINETNLIQSNFYVRHLVLLTTNGELTTEGQLDLQNQYVKYLFKISNEKDILFTIDSPGGEFKINLNNFDKKNFTIRDGKIYMKIKKIDSILPFIIDNYKPHEIQVTDKASQYNLELSSDLFLDVNNEITIKNTIINSNFIDDLKVDLRLYKVMDEILGTHLSISASKINLTYVKDVVMSDISINDILQKFFNPSKLSKYLNFHLDIQVKKIILSDGEATDLVWNTYDILNKMIIDKMKITLPGDSHLDFQGLISCNDIRKKINAKVSLESSDDISFINWLTGEERYGDNTIRRKFVFTSDVFGIQNLFKISDYTIQNGETFATGNIYLYDIPYESPIRRLLLNGYKINLDQLGLTERWDSYLTELYSADADKTGEDYFRLTNANRWIRSINTNLYLALKLQDTTIRGEKIPNITAALDVNPNMLNIHKLKLEHEKINGEVNFVFFLPVLRPQLTADIKFNTLDFQYATKVLVPKMHEDDKINFFSAHNYDGSLKFKIDKLITDKETIATWVNGEAKLKFGNISIPKVQYSMWNGQFEASADIVISSNKPIFECAVSIYNIDPRYMFYKLTGIDKITGYMSLAGNMKGKLTTWDDLNKINGKLDFMGAEVIWDGFNLDKLVEIVDGNYTNNSKLQGVEYYSKYGSTTFDVLKGTIVINDGLVSIDNANVNDSRLAGLFSANYDLGSKTVNSAASFAFIPSGSTQSLTINMKTDGNIANSNSEVDYSQVSEFINSSGKK